MPLTGDALRLPGIVTWYEVNCKGNLLVRSNCLAPIVTDGNWGVLS
jgi:hypothetical protein